MSTDASRETAPTEAQAVFDKLEARRGRPIENIFLMLAREPNLCEAVLGLASFKLRKSATTCFAASGA